MSIGNLLSTHAFDYIALRVNYGLTGCEDLCYDPVLNWYVLLTKGIIVLWKKENEVSVSLLVKFYAMALYNDVCTCVLTVLKCLIEASNGYSSLIIVMGKVQLCLVYSCATRDVPTVVSTDHHSDKIAITTNSLISTKISTPMKMFIVLIAS